MQFKVFPIFLGLKKPEVCFVLHPDWNYSCLPKLCLLISETFTSVIWTVWQGKMLFEVLSIISTSSLNPEHLEEEKQNYSWALLHQLPSSNQLHSPKKAHQPNSPAVKSRGWIIWKLLWTSGFLLVVTGVSFLSPTLPSFWGICLAAT